MTKEKKNESVIDEKTVSRKAISDDDIQKKAYEIFVNRGSLPGNEIENWLQAEKELLKK